MPDSSDKLDVPAAASADDAQLRRDEAGDVVVRPAEEAGRDTDVAAERDGAVIASKTATPLGRTAGQGDAISPPSAPRRALLPTHRSMLTVWLTALACMACALLPLMVDVNRPPSFDSHEREQIQRSLDTHKLFKATHVEGWSLGRLTPVDGWEPRVDLPPGVVWLHLASWSGLPAEPSFNEALDRARFVSVVFGLVLIGAIFWAGYGIGGWAPGTLAAPAGGLSPMGLHPAGLGTADGPAPPPPERWPPRRGLRSQRSAGPQRSRRRSHREREGRHVGRAQPRMVEHHRR